MGLMMRSVAKLSAMVLLALMAGPASSQADNLLTYPALVDWLTDFERLALLPAMGERTGLSSSYDRASQYDADHDRYVNWGANADGGGVIRHEDIGDVLAVLKGPGALVRIWSATAATGHLKFFFDGAETPILDTPFARLFDHGLAPFYFPALVYIAGAGVPGPNNYVPIPFKRSLKIVADPGWGNYYQFTYVQFPQFDVASFTLPLSAKDLAALGRANEALGADAGDGSEPRALPAAKPTKIDVSVKPGETRSLIELVGPAAISNLRIKLQLPSEVEAHRRMLRELALRVTWDDDAAPSIWSPLGDFFGFFGGAQKFKAYPVGVERDGAFYSRWFMPFARRAKIEIVNDGGEAVPVECELVATTLRFPVSAYGRFHAKWHRDAFLPDRVDRQPDWTILTTKGRGRFVGTHLHVWNPKGSWWGEGDEKFFVDGEKFPSEFGTGSEDYFGYAWSSSGLFSRPYHNQILNEKNAGHIVVNRWHFADSTPFQTSFEGAIEKYFPNDRPTLYSAVAYWYLSAGGEDPYGPVPLAERLGYWAN
jgi:Protein of unknown function (DUF2961)